MLGSIFGRQKWEPEKYEWNMLKGWIYMTQDDFAQLYNKRRSDYEVAATSGGEKRAEPGLLSPKEAWDEIKAIDSIRRDLICSGWLPPRDKDIRATTINMGFSYKGTPKAWAASRSYSEDELPKFTVVWIAE